MKRKPSLPTTNHARVEQTHALAGLFSSVTKGKGERPRRVVAYNTPTGETWRFIQPWALDAADQTVFLASLALASTSDATKKLNPEAASKILALWGEAVGPALNVHTSGHQVCTECGWEWSGRRWKLLNDSLDRLSHTTFDVIRDGAKVSMGSLIYRGTDSNGRVVMTINPYLSRVMLGEQAALWSKISLTERRSLRSDVARLLHTWLCTWLRPGETRSVQVDTLMRHVWATSSSPLPSGTIRKRRHELRTSLGEVAQLPGWRVGSLNENGSFEIHRPRDLHQQTKPRSLRRWGGRA